MHLFEGPGAFTTPSTETNCKKKYDRPELVIYGPVAELTRNTGNNGTNDNGTHALQKTF
jgi:hypothetical protein